MPRLMTHFALLLTVFPFTLLAELTHTTDPETKLNSWKLVDNSLQLEIIQRLPDQTRAFFQARGFSAHVADQIATHCVLQAIARNTATDPGSAPITIKLTSWQIRQQGKTRPIKLKEGWLAEWKKDPDISNKAKTAFRWATFPSEQTYQPDGDYNWGMISFGPAPGETFDLEVSWKVDQEIHKRWIKSIQCPSDR